MRATGNSPSSSVGPEAWKIQSVVTLKTLFPQVIGRPGRSQRIEYPRGTREAKPNNGKPRGGEIQIPYGPVQETLLTSPTKAEEAYFRPARSADKARNF